MSNSMEQSPSWEADSHSISQEIPFLLWNTKVHSSVNKSPPLVLIMSQIHPVHNFPTYFRKIHCNIILPSTPRSSQWSFPSGFPTNILYASYLLTYSSLHGAGYYLKSWLSLSLSKNVPLSYGTRRFITVFTKARHWTLSRARRIQFAPSIPISLRS
jgi:hypothetical protein